jgi:predicted nucleotidyltransferase
MHHRRFDVRIGASIVNLPREKALIKICRRYNIRRLELFGSAATDQFDPTRSDVDFLIEFQPDTDLGPWLKQYFALRHELSHLYQREVDVVLSDAIRDDRMKQQAAKTRMLLYDGTKDGQVA